MFKRSFVLLMIPALLLAACGSASESQPLESFNREQSAAPVSTQRPAGQSTAGESADSGMAVAQETLVEDLDTRIILRNATLSLQVENPTETAAIITRMVEEAGGWVVSSSFNTFIDSDGSEKSRGSMTVRVPAEGLNQMLSAITAQAEKVIFENVTGEDVTSEYVDLNSQLENLKAAEDQLQQIMDDAATIPDVLAVYNELVNIRGQIDVIEGRLQYFREAAAYSSVTIELNPPPTELEIEEEKWRPGETIEDAFDALVEGLQFAADVLIYAVICLLPLAVVGGVPMWFVWRRLRRRVTKSG